MVAVRIGCAGSQHLLETFIEGTEREDRRFRTRPVLNTRLSTGVFHDHVSKTPSV